jgi:glycosyltransferase involved in cell wall biosynthesis
MNTPVVATGHGGVLDIIREGENGAFYAAGNSGMLAEKIMVVRELSFDGHGYVKRHFSLDQMVEKTVKVYKTCIQERG